MRFCSACGAELLAPLYHSRPLDDTARLPDSVETDDARWFSVDALPPDEGLAPSGRSAGVLHAWRAARDSGQTETLLLDRPD